MLTPNFCLSERPERMTEKEIKGCINGLIFNEKWQREVGATDPESLNIVILREKAKHLNFLQGYTKWKSIGTWRQVTPEGKVIRVFPDEKNISLQIEFLDRPDEKVGKQLLKLFTELNKREIKEELLYSYTVPIEETTLHKKY